MQQKRKPLRLVMVAEIDGVIAGYGRARHDETPDEMQPWSFPEGWYFSGLLVRSFAARASASNLLGNASRGSVSVKTTRKNQSPVKFSEAVSPRV